jgi:hypothetical protein
MIFMAGTCMRCEYYDGYDWCEFYGKPTHPGGSCPHFSPSAPIPSDEYPDDSNESTTEKIVK